MAGIMSKVYERTENGTITIVSGREALDEVNHAMMDGKRDVRRMSSGHGDHSIEYKDGRTVRLIEVDAPCGNRWKYGKDVGAREAGHIGPHRNTKSSEAHSFRWFDNEGTPAAEEQAEQGPKVWTGEVTRIVTVKGKRYVVGTIRPAGDHGTYRIPRAYVQYWSERNGEAFGATRSTNGDAKPGTVGRAIWDAVNR